MDVFTDKIFSRIACLLSSSSGHQFFPDVLEAGRVSCPQLSINQAVSALPELVDGICPMLLPMYLSILIHLRTSDSTRLELLVLHMKFSIIQPFDQCKLLFYREFHIHSPLRFLLSPSSLQNFLFPIYFLSQSSLTVSGTCCLSFLQPFDKTHLFFMHHVDFGWLLLQSGSTWHFLCMCHRSSQPCCSPLCVTHCLHLVESNPPRRSVEIFKTF